MAQKRHIKPRIVGYQDTTSDKFVEERQHLMRPWLPGQHFVSNAMYSLHTIWDAEAGVNEAVKFLRNFCSLHGNSTYLNDPAVSSW